MSDTPSLTFRKEVQEYLRSCQDLLSSAEKPDNPPLTSAERWAVAYYQAEVGRLFDPVGQQK